MWMAWRLHCVNRQELLGKMRTHDACVDRHQGFYWQLLYLTAQQAFGARPFIKTCSKSILQNIATTICVLANIQAIDFQITMKMHTHFLQGG